MKIGILTITPQIGFGGNLQAYALKTVLDELTSSNAEVICYIKKISLPYQIHYFVKSLYRLIVKQEFVRFSIPSEYRYIGKNLDDFHKKFLNFSKKVESSKALHNLINSSYDLVVVGSDQVWRPRYVSGIENYFLDGVHENVRKISYAASFGVSEWEFDEIQTSKCAKLLENFDIVSVREATGIKQAKDKLHYAKTVYLDLDPTMLASKAIYSKFIHTIQDGKKYIFSYILNKDSNKFNVGNELKRELGMPLMEFNTNAENGHVPLKQRIAPSIDDWISGIANSEFVFTDSFHGMVFSIIFNKPFIVYINKARGAERFISLVNILGLENRIISCQSEFNHQIVKTQINWKDVNNIIANWKNETLERLKKYLGVE